MSTSSIFVPVTEPSQTGEARRMALAAASELGFDQAEQGKVAIVATELAKNLAKHAVAGQFIISPTPNAQGLELLSVDRGPGMADVNARMRDGYSTSGTPGTGLGAVTRIADFFDVYSAMQSGTVSLARLFRNGNRQLPHSSVEYSGLNIAKPGEEVSGDAWAGYAGEGRAAFMLADGLGHGQAAADAARAARRIFQENVRYEPALVVEKAHAALRSTRGAAMAIAYLDSEARRVEFCGIGNIVAAIVSPDGVRRLVSYDGTVGHSIRKIQPFTYAWSEQSVLILHSDGLNAHWDLDRYPGILRRDPSLIATLLFRDASRQRDDASVLVAREVRR